MNNQTIENEANKKGSDSLPRMDNKFNQNSEQNPMPGVNEQVAQARSENQKNNNQNQDLLWLNNNLESKLKNQKTLSQVRQKNKEQNSKNKQQIQQQPTTEQQELNQHVIQKDSNNIQQNKGDGGNESEIFFDDIDLDELNEQKLNRLELLRQINESQDKFEQHKYDGEEAKKLSNQYVALVTKISGGSNEIVSQDLINEFQELNKQVEQFVAEQQNQNHQNQQLLQQQQENDEEGQKTKNDDKLSVININKIAELRSEYNKNRETINSIKFDRDNENQDVNFLKKDINESVNSSLTAKNLSKLPKRQNFTNIHKSQSLNLQKQQQSYQQQQQNDNSGLDEAINNRQNNIENVKQLHKGDEMLQQKILKQQNINSNDGNDASNNVQQNQLQQTPTHNDENSNKNQQQQQNNQLLQSDQYLEFMTNFFVNFLQQALQSSQNSQNLNNSTNLLENINTNQQKIQVQQSNKLNKSQNQQQQNNQQQQQNQQQPQNQQQQQQNYQQQQSNNQMSSSAPAFNQNGNQGQQQNNQQQQQNQQQQNQNLLQLLFSQLVQQQNNQQKQQQQNQQQQQQSSNKQQQNTVSNTLGNVNNVTQFNSMGLLQELIKTSLYFTQQVSGKSFKADKKEFNKKSAAQMCDLLKALKSALDQYSIKYSDKKLNEMMEKLVKIENGSSDMTEEDFNNFKEFSTFLKHFSNMNHTGLQEFSNSFGFQPKDEQKREMMKFLQCFDENTKTQQIPVDDNTIKDRLKEICDIVTSLDNAKGGSKSVGKIIDNSIHNIINKYKRYGIDITKQGESYKVSNEADVLSKAKQQGGLPTGLQTIHSKIKQDFKGRIESVIINNFKTPFWCVTKGLKNYYINKVKKKIQMKRDRINEKNNMEQRRLEIMAQIESQVVTKSMPQGNGQGVETQVLNETLLPSKVEYISSLSKQNSNQSSPNNSQINSLNVSPSNSRSNSQSNSKDNSLNNSRRSSISNSQQQQKQQPQNQQPQSPQQQATDLVKSAIILTKNVYDNKQFQQPQNNMTRSLQ